MSLDLGEVRVELRALRRGQALGRPQAGLELTHRLRAHLVGKHETDAQAAVDLTAAIRRAADRLSETDRRIVAAELNLDAAHSFDTLTERQESLAAALRCTAKTIRRRSDRALTALAVVLTAGVAELPTTDGMQHGSVDVELRRFWRLGSDSKVDVVCSEIPPEELPDYALPGDRNYLRYAKFADLDTLIYVRTRLAQLSPATTVRDFSPSEHHDTEAMAMIVIGGPPWNAKYREFLPQLPYFFEANELGQDDPLVIPQLDGPPLGPRWTPRSELVDDIGVFTRLTLTSGTTVFLLGGCLTTGVLGAARTFLQGGLAAANARWLTEQIGDDDAVVVVEARRVGGMTDAVDIASAGPLVALGRPKGSHRFELVADNRHRR